jgi:hypothetical protein
MDILIRELYLNGTFLSAMRTCVIPVKPIHSTGQALPLNITVLHITFLKFGN